MIINILEDGTMEMLYNEELDLDEIGGNITSVRASNIEPTTDGRWVVDFAEDEINQAYGLEQRIFKKRSEALAFEVKVLESRMMESPGNGKKFVEENT